jgi:hypothetical protein
VSIEVTTAQSANGDPLPEWREVHGLAEDMVSVHARRCEGDPSACGCVLVTAPPAAGKSCLVQQLVVHVGAARIQLS